MRTTYCVGASPISPCEHEATPPSPAAGGQPKHLDAVSRHQSLRSCHPSLREADEPPTPRTPFLKLRRSLLAASFASKPWAPPPEEAAGTPRLTRRAGKPTSARCTSFQRAGSAAAGALGQPPALRGSCSTAGQLARCGSSCGPEHHLCFCVRIFVAVLLCVASG